MFFFDVLFFLSPSLPTPRQAELKATLNENGTREAPLLTATHVITDLIEFEGCQHIAKTVAIVSVSLHPTRQEATWVDCRAIQDKWVDRSLVFERQQE
jgi:hypothetical protein